MSARTRAVPLEGDAMMHRVLLDALTALETDGFYASPGCVERFASIQWRHSLRETMREMQHARQIPQQRKRVRA